jgi:methylmalonyl-CoA carboxyltransferase large subunit
MKDSELRQALDEIRRVLADLTTRVSALEVYRAAPAPAPAASPTAAPDAPVAPPAPAITEDVVLAITAAVAAFLGERAHVRQIRLISSSAWATQGRVSVQASHRLTR